MQSDRPAIARALLEHGADANAGAVCRPIVTAARIGDVTLLRVLVDHGAKVSETRNSSEALWVAVGNGQVDAVSFLLAHGANPNRRDPYHDAVASSSNLSDDLLLEARATGNIAIVRFLKRYGGTDSMVPGDPPAECP